MAFLPTDFTQVNFKLNQKMVSLAIDLLELNDDDEVAQSNNICSSFTLNGSRCRKMSTVLFSATATSNWGTCDLIESFSIAQKLLFANQYVRKFHKILKFSKKFILIKFKCSNCFITYGSILLSILKFYENYETF
jgi:hypothetical protein